MAGDPDTILASLQLSSQSLGVESFEDLLPDLPPWWDTHREAMRNETSSVFFISPIHVFILNVSVTGGQPHSANICFSCRSFTKNAWPLLCGLGRADYEVLHPNAVAWDLNQDPRYRCKKSGPILSTLTTGCSHFWLKASKRCLTGLELMALHSIPICESLAKAMGSTQVDVSQLSNTARCFLAGNSMPLR